MDATEYQLRKLIEKLTERVEELERRLDKAEEIGNYLYELQNNGKS